MLGMGVLALVYGDFAMVWQPVAAWVPGRTALAYGSGVLMVVCGAGLLFEATAWWAVRVLFPYLVAWALLKAPAVVAAPGIEGVWLGLGELTALLAGGWVLFARLSGADLGFLTGERGVRWARVLFGASLLPIGLSHLIYVKPTYDLVPAWMPWRAIWSYVTGVGQMACGLGVLLYSAKEDLFAGTPVLRIVPRAAATTEACMISLFAVLCWGPMVVTTPKARLGWTAFWISWAIGSAAWVVAQSYAGSRFPRPFSTRR
jgi:uncharacterized membrane protein